MPPAAEALTVVLVEDDVDLAEVTRLVLVQEGLVVHVAHDGKAALELIARVAPDVVITDLVMPVMDGLELIQQLSGRPGPRIPVIAVSAIGRRLHAARELGADEALVKPVHPQELAATARKIWRKASGRAG